jgi:hypothetical protein
MSPTLSGISIVIISKVIISNVVVSNDATLDRCLSIKSKLQNPNIQLYQNDPPQLNNLELVL